MIPLVPCGHRWPLNGAILFFTLRLQPAFKIGTHSQLFYVLYFLFWIYFLPMYYRFLCCMYKLPMFDYLCIYLKPRNHAARWSLKTKRKVQGSFPVKQKFMGSWPQYLTYISVYIHINSCSIDMGWYWDICASWPGLYVTSLQDKWHMTQTNEFICPGIIPYLFYYMTMSIHFYDSMRFKLYNLDKLWALSA